MPLFNVLQKQKTAKGKNKPKQNKRVAEKLDRELPYVITLITIMAASGISPFGSFMKLARYKLLPHVMKEARNIVGQVHILGEDPLTAMEKRANIASSRQYRDLLLGYVSTVRNGGDIASFLQSKMKSIFEYEVSVARQSVAKIGGLVDAYMIMQVIALSMYVVVVAMSSGSQSSMMPIAMSSPVFSYLLVFVLLPAISLLILYILDKTVSSSLIGARDILLKGIYLSVAAIVLFAVLTVSGIIQQVIDPIYALPIFLLAASAWPAYRSMQSEKNMKGMDSDLPSYLRDVAESRKAGLSPEKSIIYASERIRDSTFHKVVKAFSNQLEWGVPLRKIYENLAANVKSWSALIHFRILVEAIESGGGYTTSLEILAQSSESYYNIEMEKKSMLKPYLVIAFMVTGLTSVTTLMVAETFVQVSDIGVTDGGSSAPSVQAETGEVLSSTQMFAIGIASQSWMTGFLIGKMSSGSFATGFRYAMILLLISTCATVVTQEFNLGPATLLNTPQP
ncbi:MAG: flagellar protein FlaJ [Candidatus Nitrosomirales archaeon]|jgi:flagellar protein FlaJ